MSSPKKDPQASKVSYTSSVRRSVPSSVASDRGQSKQLQFLDPRNAAAREAPIANASELVTKNLPPPPKSVPATSGSTASREHTKQLHFLNPKTADQRDAEVESVPLPVPAAKDNDPQKPQDEQPQDEQPQDEQPVPVHVEPQEQAVVPMDPEKAAAKRSLQFMTKEQLLAAQDAQENNRYNKEKTSGVTDPTTTKGTSKDTTDKSNSPATGGGGGSGANNQFLTSEQRVAAQDAKVKTSCQVAGYLADGSTKEQPQPGSFSRVAGYLDGSSKYNNNNEKAAQQNSRVAGYLDGSSRTNEAGMPTTSLRRGAPVTIDSAPGALAVGGMDGSRYSQVSYGGQSMEEGSMRASQQSNHMDDSKAGLAQALPVLDESVKQADEVGLEQVEEEDATRLKRRDQETRNNIIVRFLVVALFLVAIVIGSALGLRDRNTPGTVVVANAPTGVPSVAPSPSPTAAPTAYVLDFPEYTMAKLADPNTPQSRAYSWVLNDPNLDTYPAWRQMQRFALATFYYSTGGDSWERNDNWLDYEVSECEWFNKGNMRLQLMHMKGTLSQKVLNLFLGWFRYNWYEDFGSFWEGGDELEYYDFPCGASPEQVEEDPENAQYRFRRLWLQSHNLDGIIPDEIGLLTDMEDWSTAHNHQLRGTLPTHIGDLRNLWHMAMEDCGLVTHLPSEIGLLTNMITLSLVAQPGLKGKIPSEIGLLSNKLMYFDVPILEPLPTQIGLLTNLEFFSPQSTTVGMGSIPSELGLLTKLRLINFIDAPLVEGPIPTEIGQLSLLEMAQIRSTAVTGTLPTVLGQLSLLKVFLLDHNLFSGTIPSELAVLTDLEEFVIDGNDLTGLLPDGVGDSEWSNLELLSLKETYVTGNIPNHSCPFAVFDCSESLCGCDHCACNNSTPNSTWN